MGVRLFVLLDSRMPKLREATVDLVDSMKLEVVQSAHEWIVRTSGEEVARFSEQDAALDHAAERLRTAANDKGATLAVRYERRA